MPSAKRGNIRRYVNAIARSSSAFRGCRSRLIAANLPNNPQQPPARNSPTVSMARPAVECQFRGCVALTKCAGKRHPFVHPPPSTPFPLAQIYCSPQNICEYCLSGQWPMIILPSERCSISFSFLFPFAFSVTSVSN